MITPTLRRQLSSRPLPKTQGQVRRLRSVPVRRLRSWKGENFFRWADETLNRPTHLEIFSLIIVVLPIDETSDSVSVKYETSENFYRSRNEDFDDTYGLDTLSRFKLGVSRPHVVYWDPLSQERVKEPSRMNLPSKSELLYRRQGTNIFISKFFCSFSSKKTILLVLQDFGC